MIGKSKIKNLITVFGLILAVLFIIIATSFALHCQNTNERNAMRREITGSTNFLGVSTEIQTFEDKNKVDNSAETVCELTIVNDSDARLENWSFTLGIAGDCYIKSAEFGKVEIHQVKNGIDFSQTLNLRNCGVEDVKLDFTEFEGEILIPLKKGDRVIYYPNLSAGETPIEAASEKGEDGTVKISLAFVGESFALDISGAKFGYRLHNGYLDGKSYNVYVPLFIMLAVLFIVFTALSIPAARYERKITEQDKMIRESLGVFSNFVDAKDPYTRGHSERVARYSKKIAEKLGLSERECKQIYYVATLHDIGKCCVPDEILKKPSKLTDEEFDIIKTHTLKGAEMVMNFSSIPNIHDGILYHHERYDGKGYPSGKKGKDIPLVGRIIAVADAYDAMNSSRVYRDRLSEDEIISELERNSGTQFDPDIVEIFLEILKEEKENKK